MAAITQRYEDFIVKIMKESFSSDIIAELVFAQTYNLKKLKKASIKLLAQSLTLPELKKQVTMKSVQRIFRKLWKE